MFTIRYRVTLHLTKALYSPKHFMSAYDTARHFGFRVPAQTYRHTDKQTDRTTLLDILDLVYQHRHTDRQTDIRAGTPYNTAGHSAFRAHYTA